MSQNTKAQIAKKKKNQQDKKLRDAKKSEMETLQFQLSDLNQKYKQIETLLCH